MKPKDFYKLPPTNICHNITGLKGFLPEIDFSRIDNEVIDGLDIKYLVDQSTGNRDLWQLFGVFFKNKPFMIARAAKNYTSRFITDKKVYNLFISNIIHLYRKISDDYVDASKDIVDLTIFEGHDLSEFYDGNLIPKYKNGDVLEVVVLANPVLYKDKTVKTRVQVKSVNQYNKKETYVGIQLDRKVQWLGTRFDNVFDENNGNLQVLFCDADVIGFWNDRERLKRK